MKNIKRLKEMRVKIGKTEISGRKRKYGFNACSVQPGTFCEAATEETPVLTIAHEKPKEGVNTENNSHIN